MSVTAEAVNAPVQGPAAPAEADLLRATGTTAAAMADPATTTREREAAAEAEQATYIAARHLGPPSGSPDGPFGPPLTEADYADLTARAHEIGDGWRAQEAARNEPEAGL